MGQVGNNWSQLDEHGLRLWWGWSLECRVERCVQRCGKASNAKERTLDVTLRAMGATEGGSMGGTGMKIEDRWDGVRLKAGRR